MYKNQQNIQINIGQQNHCGSESEANTATLPGIFFAIAVIIGLIWLACVIIGSAFRALGRGLSSFADGFAAVPWLEVIGLGLLGIAFFVLSAVTITLTVGKCLDYLSARSDRRKQRREVIDLPFVIEEPPQLPTPAPHALPERQPVLFNVEPQTVEYHGNH